MNKSEMMAKIGISKIAFNDWGLKLIYFITGEIRLYSGVTDTMICKALMDAQSIKDPEWFIRRLFEADRLAIIAQSKICANCKYCECTYDTVYCCTLHCTDTEPAETCEKWEKIS